jgi:hypothetical protein
MLSKKNIARIDQKNWLLGFACLHIILAIIGCIKGYSPVPYSDMWSAVESILQIDSGNKSAWWAQHNEHRIIISRLLFWLDFKLFAGKFIFLSVTHYLLAGAIFLCLALFAREAFSDKSQKDSCFKIQIIILLLSFSWMQKGNFVWTFQSQFFFAQIFPLFSFYALYQHYKNEKISWFFLAIISATLSLGSMANGVIVPALLAILSLLLRQKLWKSFLLSSFAYVSLLLFFNGYQAAEGHVFLRDSLFRDPFGFTRFLLDYLGGPFFYLSGKGLRPLATIGGIALIAGATHHLFLALKNPKKSALNFSLLMFLLYIGATAIAVTDGRLDFGYKQATTGRYMTGSLAAWSVLLILYAPFLEKYRQAEIIKRGIFFLLPILLLPVQLDALRSQQQKHFEQQVALISLALAIPDREQQTGYLHLEITKKIEKITHDAIAQKLGIFADPILQNIPMLGTRANPVIAWKKASYEGKIDSKTEIALAPDFFRISGELNLDIENPPKALTITDHENKIIGYAITGDQGKEHGFKGYLRKDAGENLRFQ